MDAAQELIDQAYTTHHADNLPLALAQYQAAGQLLRTMDQPLRFAHTIRHVADIQCQLERPELAFTNYAEALSIYRREPAANKLDLANVLRGDPLASESLDLVVLARMWWIAARDLYREVNVQAGADGAERRISALHDS
jgi:hypothetical protein